MALFGTATKIDTQPQVENRLIFEFPNTQGGAITSRVLPFFENPRITENQEANLASYDVLGRSGNFFGYTGAKSKGYNLEFHLTLPHIVQTAAAELFTQPPSPMSRSEKKKAFFSTRREVGNNSRSSKIELIYEKSRQDLLALINNGLEPPALKGNLGQKVQQAIDFQQNSSPEYALAQDLDAYQKPFIYAQAVQLVLFWIKLIRVSVSNNQLHPTFGPPVLRIKLGALYDYISCLATKYTLTWDDSAGYDVVTYLPNRIKINLSLVQIQRNPGTDRNYAGDNLADAQTRRNEILSGWEEFEDSRSWAEWLESETPALRGVQV
tara:strand:+ start:8033 stop:9001 length:969 start_codon:yes stop_codon:yes gene_type:complete